MGAEILTKEDLAAFRVELITEIRNLIQKSQHVTDESLYGLKTAHVRKLLGCSINKLNALRISKKIRSKKIGGTVYYSKEDIRKLVNEGFTF
ncbi:helix-turn-helix domain-containing protein [Foetidibacter luteolus]|uniref:helix-turn-helix domain-containing protein n=1 Tax=Foetidibacter luteolus TaxID=2608880 RepID=UPI00129B8CFA|nr:helix-turn-helix domain-containing protein [Foetidibacter luteolus]